MNAREFDLHVSVFFCIKHSIEPKNSSWKLQIGLAKGLHSKISHDEIRPQKAARLGSQNVLEKTTRDNQTSLHVNAIKSSNETIN